MLLLTVERDLFLLLNEHKRSIMRISRLFAILVIMGVSPVTVAQTPIKIGSFVAGNAVAQFNKAISKSYVESRQFTNTMPKVIAQAEATLLLNELTKKCISLMLPQTLSAAADLGMKSVMALDLYQAIIDAQAAFPTYGEITVPPATPPFEYLPKIEQSWHETPSSTSVEALIEHAPASSASALITQIQQDLFTPKAINTFNLGLMHSIIGFGTALIGKVVVTDLVERGIDPKKNALIFKSVMTAASIAFNQWANELLKTLIVDAPANPQEEVRFYDKMCSLGTRLFITIDKTIATLPSTPTPQPLIIG
jgi:hypothetical protein